MDVIELERWKPSEEDPRKPEYAGQPIAQEVFEELKYQLDSTGCLPDEYFLMDREWENGREIPQGADIFCTVDYGESEGVYLDVYLKWRQDGKPITKSFITGKTLGGNGNDLDRMFLTASAVTKAFHGDHATHARYMKIDGVEDDTGGRVVHLSQQEEKVIINALVEQRERQAESMSQTEQLLRRMAGSITAYMDTVGHRPLHMSDYDKAVLAIRDGELDAFLALYPKLLRDHADNLLVEAAKRSGSVGRSMTHFLLTDVERFPEAIYCAACKRAVDINDPQKTASLLANAADRVENLSPSFHGEMAVYAYPDHRHIAKEIIKQCGDEQIAAAPPYLLEQFAMDRDYRTMSTLVEKGISGGPDASRTLHMLTYEGRNSWMAENLLQKRMWVDVNNYRALHACMENGAVDVAKLLLDGGMDFEQYRLRYPNGGSEETIQALEEHWNQLQAQTQEQDAAGPEIGGMNLG
ncbi:MAG: ankyrin repeat domain-containing protein [Clostridiales bacterium]|nr:ankyrin repeat domain-containing protein [Clostridiales bacterium]